jgi:hypothetical protein
VEKEFGTLHKYGQKRKIKKDTDDFDKSVVQRTINDFHTTEREHPTSHSLPALKKKLTSLVESGLFSK